MNPPSVAIVILNWNGKSYLERFLPSVLSTSYEAKRVIIADNGSTDDSVSFVENNYPEVEIIILKHNYGFAGGYNKALQEINSDYYVLLNSDVEVTENWLTPLITLLVQDPLNAACQPKILSYNNKNYFEYAGAAGGWLDLFGYPFARGRIFGICEQDNGQYNVEEEVFWASGAAMIIRSSVYHQLNGFDEYLFAHQEEIDLCWRMHRAGYKIFSVPDSVVYHIGGGTLPKGDSKKTYLNFRNNHILMAKNMRISEKCYIIPLRFILDIISGLKGILSGDPGYFRSILKGHFGFLKWLFFIKKQKSGLPFKKLRSLPGVYKGNIAWQHFVCNKQTFNEIIGLVKGKQL